MEKNQVRRSEGFRRRGKLSAILIVLLFGVSMSRRSDAQWVAVDGTPNFAVFPNAAIVHSLIAVHDASGNVTLFLGTDKDGVLLSTDDGDSWMRDGLQRRSVYAFAVNNDGTSDADVFAGTDSGTYRSSLDGPDWIRIDSGWVNPTYHYQYAVGALAFAGTTLLAGTYGGGVYTSTDYGETWTASDHGLADSDVTALGVLGNDIFAGTGWGGVFHSTDDGKTWSTLNSGLEYYQASVSGFAAVGSDLFAGTDYGVFRLSPGDTQWVKLNNGLKGGCSSLASHNGSLFAGTGLGFFLSTDDGDCWTQTDSGTAYAAITEYVAAIAFAGTNVFVGTFGNGILRSSDMGRNWTSVTSNLDGAYIYSLLIDTMRGGGQGVFAGAGYNVGVFHSDDYGGGWIPENTSLGNRSVYSLASIGGTIFAGTNGSGIFISSDHGLDWSPAALNSGKVYALTVQDGSVFAGTEDAGIFRTTDDGITWYQVNNGLTNEHVWSLAADDQNIFTGTNGGGVFLSTDHGASWTQTISGLGSKYVWSLLDNADGHTSILAGTSKGLYILGNGRTDWSSAGLDSTNIFSLALIGGKLLAGTYGDGIFLSTNNGQRWTEVDSGLSNKYVWSMAVLDSFLFAGTGGAGVWRRSLSQLVTEIEINNPEIPSRFALQQNYPNPFNPTTTITYSLSERAFVQIKVYNILGQEVRKLVDSEEPAGQYSVIFSGNGLANGVYLYRLVTANVVLSRKAVLLK